MSKTTPPISNPSEKTVEIFSAEYSADWSEKKKLRKALEYSEGAQKSLKSQIWELEVKLIQTEENSN